MNLDNFFEYVSFFKDLFIASGLSTNTATILGVIINSIIFIAIVTLLDIIVRKFIVQGFKIFSTKSINTYDDYLVQSNFPRYIAHYVPLTLSWYFIPIIFEDFNLVEFVLLKIVDVYLVILSVLVVRSILRTSKNYLERDLDYSDKPLQSYLQVLMIFAWGIGVFIIANIITGFSIKSLTTLGATSAIILLIFKDTILGFVSSIQVTVNDIVRIGDWITFSKYGADGYVTEINLATVRVQNFDNTYTTIPTYSLTADSFQNWRGMQESKGRRIKRAIYIKQNSVRFLTEEDIEKFKKIQLIKPYIEHRQKDVLKYNKQVEADKSLLINGKNQTNLGVFRKYADAYLHENPAINKDLFLMVRHLAPTERGIPIEIFCFSYDKNWVNYEHIQADIFDHLVAAVSYFDLEIFENPSSKDLSKILLTTPSD